MRQAAAMLVGRHDFKAFETTGSPRAHTVRHVVSAGWQADGSGLIRFQIEADGFLRCMVRNIVGTLVAVGLQRIRPEKVQEILSSRNRRYAASTAPPQGLFLMEVKYEANAPSQPNELPGYSDSFTF
jgi:tRNA pseudouridine38-40 synthase